MFQSLIDEVNEFEDSVTKEAVKYTESLSDIYADNYTFYERNEQFFQEQKQMFLNNIEKFKKKQLKLAQNLEQFKSAYDSGQIISDSFIKMDINKLYKVPETVKLPAWFAYFKEEEFTKVKDQLNAYALRLFRTRCTDQFRGDRKKMHKRIENLIQDITEKYEDPLNLPTVKINELQHYIEELQQFDRIIPEIAVEIMHKSTDYARAVVTAFLEFRQQSSDFVKSIQ